MAAPSKGFGATDPRIAPYVEGVLKPEDEVLREIRSRSIREGLPPIAVGPFDGRHLEVLARMAGARRIVEIGTLGGYSGVCLARALSGRLDVRLEPRHAVVARSRSAGRASPIRCASVGPAFDRLREIRREEAVRPRVHRRRQGATRLPRLVRAAPAVGGP
jgi:caffeoyl-CoA O-methyltransferase